MNFSPINMDEIQSRLKRYQLDSILILQQRKEQIYQEIPEIYEIDQTIASGSLSAAKARILSGFGENAPSISDIRSRNRELSQKKLTLLTEHGYPADYLEPQYHCRKCQDTGYVNQTACSCLRQMIIDEMYRQSNLRNILEVENFNTFSLDYYSKEASEGETYSPYVNMSNILQRSHRFTEEFDQRHENILIYGETGLGKTFLTNCIAKQLLDTGHTVLYLSANELFEQVLSRYIMSSKKTSELSALYDHIFSCDFLIIDDLGTELTNNFTLSQFFEIVNQRILSRRSTLISTNLTIKQLQERYTERIMSRLVADYMVFYIYGNNIRYQKRKAMIHKANEN